MNRRQRKRALAYLKETAEHYNSGNRSVMKSSGGLCLYVPDSPNSEGCAVGRKLPKWMKKKIMGTSKNSAGVGRLFAIMGRPRFFKGMNIRFIKDVQILHDDWNNWNPKGLSEWGEIEVADIIKRYNLQ